MIRLSHPLAFALIVGCSSSDDGGAPHTVETIAVTIDASSQTGDLRPLWGDHYDLSFEHFDYAAEPGFSAILADLAPRSWRCSVGRWEVGFPPPQGGASLDPAALASVDREFYRGPSSIAGADDPSNYHFDYLDAQLAGLIAEGVEPFLCFDYMPFTLAAEQDPANANNANVHMPGTPFSMFSFSNGIRTSPPADPAVYARVVRNTIRHIRGHFAGITDYGIRYVEIGNEPDAVDLAGMPLPYFWTGSEAEFYAMYAAIAAEVDADPFIQSDVEIGAGSFALLPSPGGVTFFQSFVARVAAGSPRLDYLSFHSYGDEPEDHLGKFLLAQSITSAAGISVPWVNGEWGRQLGGTDPVYDLIEHGILRTKVMMLMQVFPFEMAHEALLRNPGTSSGELGLIKTGPPAHKPVSRVYELLSGLTDTGRLLEVTSNSSDLYVLPAINAANDEVAIAIAVDEPGQGTVTRIELDVQSLPWVGSAHGVILTKVTQSTSGAGGPPQIVASGAGFGGQELHTFDVVPGESGVYVLELTEQ